MNQAEYNKLLQRVLNASGENLAEDGLFGKMTIAAASKYDFAITARPKTVVETLNPAGQKFVEPTFVVVKGTKFQTGKYKTKSGKFAGLVVHYTVSGRNANSAIAVVKYLASKGYGCMVMDENGIIYIPEDFDIFTMSAAHAGDSEWNGRRYLNGYYAGMEICCMGRGSSVGPFRTSKGEANINPGTYQEYTAAQEASLINFCLWAASKNPEFSLGEVCGHDEARAEFGKPGDKSDPGASLSMTMPQFRKLLASK